MKLYKRYIFGILTVIATSATAIAQDVRIEVPLYNIINGVEFNTTRTVLNTGTNNKWWSNDINPTMWSLNSEFKNATGAILPTSVLHWQLDNIGGQTPPFHNHDILPPFKWFTTSPQTWFEPKSRGSQYTPGNVVFKFKIPASAFTSNTFVGGEYSITVTHNYGSGFHGETFTPDSFKVILIIPFNTPIKWISNNTLVYHEVSSLNSYRSMGDKIISIGRTEIANSVPFNFWAKTTSSSIQFTSSKGVESTRSPSFIKLGSTHPKIVTSPLSANWRNYSPNSPFMVEVGNKNVFDLNLIISKTDLKNHFFEAGTYRVQLEFDAKSSDNTNSALQNTDVTLKVLPLSEITIPTGGKEVNFEFNTVSQYQNGQTKVIPNHLKLSNNETYELYVKSDVSFFRKAGIQSDVPSSILQIGAEGGSSIVPLSPTAQRIINNGTPVLDMNLNMKYVISASSAQTLVAKEKNTYSLNVIYSFTAL